MRIPMTLAAAALLASRCALAQLTCATPAGSCALATGGPVNASCYCATPHGPVSGVTSMNVSAPHASESQALPGYCCTAAGRMGPYKNTSLSVGAVCSAALPNGSVMSGQACY